MATLTNEQGKLALKAAQRWDTSDKGQAAQAMLQAFGEVAADVLSPQMVLAPFGFTQAIRSALEAVPAPSVTFASRENAVMARNAWENAFLVRFEEEIN